MPIPVQVQEQPGLDPPRRTGEERLRDTFTIREPGETLFLAADWDRHVPGMLFKAVGVLLAISLPGMGLTFGILVEADEESLLPYGLNLIPLCGGLILGYIAICYKYNRTEVSIDSKSLRIWHGPLPWKQPRVLPASELTQFLVRKNSYWNMSDESDMRWDLLAISHYGANQTVFSGNIDREALETVEYLIEKHLKIVDQAVRG